MNSLIRSEIKLVRAFMPVLVTSNFDADSIKNERASMETQHFPIISLWEIFRRSKVANSVVSGPVWPKFELVRDFMYVLVTCKYKKDRMKNKRENVNGGFLLPWKPEFWSNLPQSLMHPFPHPDDVTHKIWSRLADWLQRYSSLKVWTTTDDDGRTTDHWYTISSPCEHSTQVS